jgi:hypothetical protein
MVAEEGERPGRPGSKALRGWASAAPRHELNAEAIGRYCQASAAPMSLGVRGLALVAYLGLPGTPDPWSDAGYRTAATFEMGPPGFEPGTNGL